MLLQHLSDIPGMNISSICLISLILASAHPEFPQFFKNVHSTCGVNRSLGESVTSSWREREALAREAFFLPGVWYVLCIKASFGSWSDVHDHVALLDEPVLGSIDANFCRWHLIFQHFSRSKILSPHLSEGSVRRRFAPQARFARLYFEVSVLYLYIPIHFKNLESNYSWERWRSG